MDLGFETIGNATLICHDGGPLLATDPWIVGSAYFGSWIHQHQIPPEQMEAVKSARYVWISHGHPDHLSLESLQLLRGAEILLPDHYGGRIYNWLRSESFRVWILKDGLWTQLSDRVRVLSLADCHQDAALLIDMDGHLLVNTNDAGDRGAGRFVSELIPKFKSSFLFALMAYGDADMINVFDESGNRVPPTAAKKEPLGPGIAMVLDKYGIRNYVPFATLHKYQRSDSAWVNDFITTPDEIGNGFESDTSRMLPAYVRYDLLRDEATSIDPPPVPGDLHEPEEFGDNWSDVLSAADVEKLKAYFAPITHLQRFLGFLNFRVGGKDNTIDLNRGKFDRGITFETPRKSLMDAVEWKIFDDLMIGNFTKTTLHGDWDKQGAEALYPDFNPFVCKYADNGGAYTADQIKAYFAEYKRRGFFSFGPSEADLRAKVALAPYL